MGDGKEHGGGAQRREQKENGKIPSEDHHDESQHTRDGRAMKAALATPFLHHLPIHPGTYLGYGAAVLQQHHDLDVFDLNLSVHLAGGHRRNEILAQALESPVVFDHFHLQPLYAHLHDLVPAVYADIAWDRYDRIAITSPSWFVTVPTKSILELVAAIRRKAPAASVLFFGNSIGTWTNAETLKNQGVQLWHLNEPMDTPARNRPVDFDQLPTPAYKQRERYLFDFLPFRLKHGCAWGRCRFCSLSRGWNAGYRERSPGRVLRELADLQERYRPAMFVCRDNAVNGENLKSFCRGFSSIDKPWIAAARADLDREAVRLMAKSGCRAVYFGLESGSDRVLQELDKGILVQEMSLFIQSLHGEGILAAPSLFVGAPEETESDFQATVRFVQQHSRFLEIVNLYPFRTTPGSAYAQEGRMPAAKTGERLSQLVRVCREEGLTICVGEQGAEYRLAARLCHEPGDMVQP